jgi:hypothetical protein
MRQSLWIVVTLVIASLAAPGVLAGNSKEVFLREGTVVEGKTIADGAYTLKWTSGGGPTEISVARGGSVLAKTDATWETRDAASENDAVVYEKNGEGWKIKEIRFAGKKDVLVPKG